MPGRRYRSCYRWEPPQDVDTAALKATDKAWWLACANGLVAGRMDLELLSRK